MRKFLFTAALMFGALIGLNRASADVIAQVDISTQRMTVMVDGEVRYVWPVSTARRGYATPIGSFRPIRMERTGTQRSIRVRPCHTRSSSTTASPFTAQMKPRRLADLFRTVAFACRPPPRANCSISFFGTASRIRELSLLADS